MRDVVFKRNIPPTSEWWHPNGMDICQKAGSKDKKRKHHKFDLQVHISYVGFNFDAVLMNANSITYLNGDFIFSFIDLQVYFFVPRKNYVSVLGRLFIWQFYVFIIFNSLIKIFYDFPWSVRAIILVHIIKMPWNGCLLFILTIAYFLFKMCIYDKLFRFTNTQKNSHALSFMGTA